MKDFFEKYRDRIDIGEPEECWEWLGAKASMGYGHFNRDRRHYYAHRAAYEAANNTTIPADLVCRHKCDNPSCVNPAHLEPGTHLDNRRDAMERGRDRPVRGGAHPRAKLTEDVVLDIRRLADSGETMVAICQRYPLIQRGCLEQAVNGKTWRHLPGATRLKAKAKPPGGKPGGNATQAVLRTEDVINIRRLLSEGEKGVTLARRYGVSTATISAIRVGRQWRCLL